MGLTMFVFDAHEHYLPQWPKAGKTLQNNGLTAFNVVTPELEHHPLPDEPAPASPPSSMGPQVHGAWQLERG
jgi:hypothetical protein